MPDSLGAVWSSVVKNLKTVYSEFLRVDLANLVHQFGQILQYHYRHIDHIPIVCLRNDERVVGRYRVVIQKSHAGITLEHDCRSDLFSSNRTKNTIFHQPSSDQKFNPTRSIMQFAGSIPKSCNRSSGLAFPVGVDESLRLTTDSSVEMLYPRINGL